MRAQLRGVYSFGWCPLQLWNVPVETHAELVGLVKIVTRKFAPHHEQLLHLLESVKVDQGALAWCASINTSGVVFVDHAVMEEVKEEDEEEERHRDGGSSIAAGLLWVLPRWMRYVFAGSQVPSDTRVETYVGTSDMDDFNLPDV